LKQHQRDQKTKEAQERMRTGGGPEKPSAEVDPDIEAVVPHLMVKAPTLFSSNMTQNELCELQLEYHWHTRLKRKHV